ncbi:hypothetical protein [Acidovorax sp. NCPPB 4044]|uniref:hypothetical protein n=1 Tax=Acidovorax sp. NCPPB 4044 TaxID=2940490 RepID=UPI002303CB39|nr:hypothetical protein [Acidovorax sp. NCPPB 4044]MDA8522333.1 hypothetical protein [Acidovorax sp. NCPPB 4044]
MNATTTITFKVDEGNLPNYTDEYLAALWHIAQANPAPFGDSAACAFAEHVGREIISRWLGSVPPELWLHQGRHAAKASDAARTLRDDLLRDTVAPGQFITLAEAMLRLGFEEGGAVQESTTRDALIRLGFTAGREPHGLRRRGWIAPGGAA